MSQSRNLRRLYTKKIRPQLPVVKRGLRGLIRRQTIALACVLLAVCFVLGADYYKSAAILKTSKEVVVADKRQSVNWQNAPKILIDRKTGKRIDSNDASYNFDAPLGGGDTCGTASVIAALPFNDSGTTVGTADTYDLPADVAAPTVTGCPTCTATGGGPAGAAPRGGVYTGTGTGPDVAYSITFTSANNSLNVTMTPTGGQDLALIVYTNVCSNNLADAIVVDDDGAVNAAETVTISNMPAGTYNIVVDGYSAGATPPGPSGPYTLAVTGTGTIGGGGTPVPTNTFTPSSTATSTATGTPAPTCTPASFSNPAAITINDNTAASPYPSDIAVAGLTGTVTKVTVDLTGVNHTFPDDIDVLLVGPGGQNTLLMSDVGGGGDIVGVNLTFDDAAAAGLPDATQITGGTFKPTNFDTTTDVFPAPAPAAGATVALSVFNGSNPNGTWSLYVRDDLGIDLGSISGGWALRITTSSCVIGTPTRTNTATPTSTGTPLPTSTNSATATATATSTPGGASAIYAVDLRNLDFDMLTTTNPLATRIVNNLTAAQSSFFGGDFANNDFTKIYTINDFNDTLNTINVATGVITPVGPTGAPAGAGAWVDMTFDRTTNTMYAMSNDATLGTSIYTVNLATGAATLIASNNVTTVLVIDGAIHPTTGVFYGVDITGDNLVTINKTTAAVTTVGPLGINAAFAQGMDFEDATGTLYWAAYRGSAVGPGQLRTINITTGASTLIGDITNGVAGETVELDSFSIASAAGGSPTPTFTGTPPPTATNTQTPTATATSTGTPAPTCTPSNFSNPAAITINDNAAGAPYPSNITVAGLTGTVTKVTVDLTGVNHTFPDDIDVLLVSPGGQNTLLMSDVGGGGDIVAVNLTFDDAAAANLPDATQITGGTFKPTNFDTTTDVFPAPAPAAGATVALNVFNGSNPNGIWSLYVRDDLGIDLGSISGGWAIHITTTTCTGGTPPPTATRTNTATPTSTATVGATATGSATCTPAGTPGVLYDQSNNAGTNGTSSQDFEAANDTFDDRAGDDFVVPAGQTWTVSRVVVGGQYFNGAGPAASFNVTFYSNTGALPGAVVAGGTFTGATYTNASGTFTITLPGSVALPAGTYWVSVQARMDFTPGGQWAWTDRTTTNNSPAAWQNPGGGFAVPACVPWAPRGATCAIDPTAPDQIFQIVGTNGAGGGCGTPISTSTGTPSGTPTFTASSTATATSTGSPAGTCTPSNFSNPAAITINDNAAGAPYPSNISVAGLTGTVTKVTVDLTGVNHTFPDDIDVLLVGPGGQNTLLMSDTGGGGDVVAVNLTFDDAAAAGLPDATQITGGTFKPTNFDTTTDVFPAPAPAAGATVALSVFNGVSGNGTWSLYVRDDLGIDLGSISGGWALHITTTSCPGNPTSTNTSTPSATATATATGTPPAATVQFSSATYTEDESQTAVITINRTGSSAGTTTVNFATSNGTAIGGAACGGNVDYISVAQSVTFNPGETSKTVNVQICGDLPPPESTETINLTLTGASVGSPATAVLSINDTASAFRNGTAICTTLGGPGIPYPSNITVANGPVQIGNLRVTLYDITHQFPDHMDFLLVSPAGRQMIIQSDAGGLVDLTVPVTITFSDFANQVLPDSGPLTTGLFEPTSWQPGQSSFLAPAPPAPYNEPGSAVGGTPSLASVFGLSNANGVWALYMRDDAGLSAPLVTTGCVNGGWGLEFLVSTAAQSSISGRVVTASGQGIRNAKVVVTGNSLSQPMVVSTGTFGHYTLNGLATGETYVVTVNSQRYTFSTPSRVISLVDNVGDADFVADPQ